MIENKIPMNIDETLQFISKYLTDKEISILLHTKQATIYRWKSGERTPTKEFSNKIIFLGNIVRRILETGELINLGKMLVEMKNQKKNRG